MCNMTRQHFQFIADIIKTERDDFVRPRIARAFAKELRRTNPNFKPERFFKACNVEGAL